jgi:hypothetical protein
MAAESSDLQPDDTITLPGNILPFCVIAICVVAVGVRLAGGTWRAPPQDIPPVLTNELQLVEKRVFSCCDIGTVRDIALSNFDADQKHELALLGSTGVAMLAADDFTVEKQTNFRYTGCDSCYALNETLLPDKGSFLVATGSGVFDSTGHLIWAAGSIKSRRIAFIPAVNGASQFVGHTDSSVIMLNRHGAMVWVRQLAADDVGSVVSESGERLPFAVGTSEGAREIRIYTLQGDKRKSIRLPFWATSAMPASWPSAAHFVVGAGREIGVIDQEGNEVLHHSIAGTSFVPIGAPRGVAVRFSAGEQPYLAVIVNSGLIEKPRSVLLVFNYARDLVWQREMDQINAVVAIPRAIGGEALLVGGWDGAVEFSLSAPVTR